MRPGQPNLHTVGRAQAFLTKGGCLPAVVPGCPMGAEEVWKRKRDVTLSPGLQVTPHTTTITPSGMYLTHTHTHIYLLSWQLAGPALHPHSHTTQMLQKNENSRGHPCPVVAPQPCGSSQIPEAPQEPQITIGEGVFILRTQSPLVRVLIAAAIWWRERGVQRGSTSPTAKVGEARGRQPYPGRAGPARGWSRSRRTRSPPHCRAPRKPPLLLLLGLDLGVGVGPESRPPSSRPRSTIPATGHSNTPHKSNDPSPITCSRRAPGPSGSSLLDVSVRVSVGDGGSQACSPPQGASWQEERCSGASEKRCG